MKKYCIITLWLLGIACNQESTQQGFMKFNDDLPEITHPEWVRDAVIYEVNIRQYSPEGTFKAFQEHLPRLKELGVDILWLMPIHPIGEANRKGSLGSYYSVSDYRKINPEFGVEEDFQNLVDAIHQLGMKVIIDWVGNHTSWDNWLTKEHPDWYLRNYKGEFVPPLGWDWSDVIVLDYNQQGLRDYMLQSMEYWVEEFDVDGYRCDVAGYVPTDFWVKARSRLNDIKPVFMLAEWEDRAMHYAFDMTYAWELEEAMKQIAKGEKDASAVNSYIAKMINSTMLNEIKMTHTSNHDQNSWEGSVFERFGKAAEGFAVLSYIIEGMPLIYGGQEVGLNKSLAFFEKDEISWGDHPFNALYSRLNKLKKDNPALWNGGWGGRMLPIATTAPKQVNVIYRERAGNRILGVFNSSPEEVTFTILGDQYSGDYKSFKSRSSVSFSGGEEITLGPWGYDVYTAK
ncbi:MAG: alpha-amylase family glycosyl hydrolase [Marinoscillum sp.]